MWKVSLALLAALSLCLSVSAREIPESKWRPVEIDRIQIGYGLQMADVNGDKKTDVVLADKNTIQWYENPSWTKHIIARDLTERDNVCVTARDIDGEPWKLIKVLDEALKDGHALAVDDYLGVGSDQIVVGWRAMNDPGVPGIRFFTPLDADGTQWRMKQISAEKVAIEDIKAADLNNDGKVDIVAAARQTKNLVIFFNERD